MFARDTILGFCQLLAFVLSYRLHQFQITVVLMVCGHCCRRGKLWGTYFGLHLCRQGQFAFHKCDLSKSHEDSGTTLVEASLVL